MATLEHSKHPLHVPSLDDLVAIWDEALSKNFANVRVSTTRCPDLTKPPFYLASSGLCGSPRIADVGGVPNLVPVPQKEKYYSLDAVAKLAELPDAFMIGPGAGPWRKLGINSELIANVKLSAEQPKLESYAAWIDPNSEACVQKMLTDTCDFSLMANLFISEGAPGQVVAVQVSGRTGPENFVTCLRKALVQEYGDAQPVGIGGCFVIETGRAMYSAKLHIMPDFPDEPFADDDAVDKWLTYHDMGSPLVCLSVFVSSDMDLDLRTEHTHCFSKHGEGGHYHYDVTPDDVSYVGYFLPAELMYRVDRPKQK